VETSPDHLSHLERIPVKDDQEMFPHMLHLTHKDGMISI
jgi:hypothetical protein